MKMDTDAEGFLLFIVPIALRMDVNIINIDTSKDTKQKVDAMQVFNI
jgi:hypothetical protein